jgi:hypothetical protein
LCTTSSSSHSSVVEEFNNAFDEFEFVEEDYDFRSNGK